MFGLVSLNKGEKHRKRLLRSRVLMAEPLERRDLLTVFGNDTRYPVPVSAISTAPRTDYRNFASVGQVVTAHGSGTGVLIAPNVVLTNAHNLVQNVNGKPSIVNTVSFYPGRSQANSTPYGVATANRSQIRVAPNYLSNIPDPGSTNVYDDYALIFLNSDIGRFTGWMDISVYSEDFFNGRMLTSAGYPGDKFDRTTGYGVMHVTAGPSSYGNSIGRLGTIEFAGRDYSDRVYSHPYSNWSAACQNATSIIDMIRCLDTTSGFDVMPGQSGSPVWYTEVNSDTLSVRWNVVGLIAGSTESQNSAMRITQEVYDQIENWMGKMTKFPIAPIYNNDTGVQMDEPGLFLPDLTDYGSYFDQETSTLASTSARRGDMVGFSFVAYNAGNLNLSEAATLNIYASADEVLSTDDVLLHTGSFTAEKFMSQTLSGAFSTALIEPGDYNIVWKIDSEEAFKEADETNNSGRFSQKLTLKKALPIFTDSGSFSLEIDELNSLNYEFQIRDPYPDSHSTLQVDVRQIPDQATLVLTPQGQGSYVAKVNWLPSESDDGQHLVIIDAKLNGSVELTTTQVITITVNEVNQPPRIRPVDSSQLETGNELSLKIEVEDSDGADEAEEAVIEVINIPTGAKFDSVSRIFQWHPETGQEGSYNIGFRAKRGDEQLGELEFVQIVVIGTNFAPELILAERYMITENVYGDLAGSIAIQDKNKNQIHVISLSDERFEIVDNQIKLRSESAIDFENEWIIPLYITVRDDGVPSAHSQSLAMIQVINQIEPPEVQLEVSNDIIENVAGLQIGFIHINNTEFQDNAFAYIDNLDSPFSIIGNEVWLKPDHYLNDQVDALTFTVKSLHGLSSFSFDIVGRTNPTPWTNPSFALDVNGDEVISPSDALFVINTLNTRTESSSYGILPIARPFQAKTYFDVNSDGRVTPSDALIIINKLNNKSPLSEGEDSLALVQIDAYFEILGRNEVAIFPGNGSDYFDTEKIQNKFRRPRTSA